MSLRFFRWILCLSIGLLSLPGRADQSAAAPSSPEDSASADPAHASIQQALRLLKARDVPGAAEQLAEGLKLNPHSVVAHVLLGSLYASKRLLPQAEEQFTLAEADAPADVSIKFFLADIKLAEGDYAPARARYAALENAPGREDFAAYKVFLCDLLGKQEDMAARELAAFKQAEPKASYYFANAAWCVSHKDSPSAQKWLNTAAATFPMKESAPYVQALRNIGFLPLPPN